MFINFLKKLTLSSNFLLKDVPGRVSITRLCKKLIINTDWTFLTKIKQQSIKLPFIGVMAESSSSSSSRSSSNGNCKNVDNSFNRIDTIVGVSKVQQQRSRNQQHRQYREESIRQVRSLSSSSLPSYLNNNNNYVINPYFQRMVAMNNYQYTQQLPQFDNFINYQMPVFQSYSQPLYFHRPQVDQQQTRSLHKRLDEEDSILNGVRYWEDLPKKTNSTPGFEFIVMSYNVLAQDLLEQHPYLYNDCKHSALKWKTRWTNLYNEITQFNPDILCLQEVQDTHLDTYFAQLKHFDYAWIYKRRTGIRTDGCAIFYKKTNLNLIESITVEYNQPKAPVLNRDNVAIIGKFTSKQSPNNEFIVATTHLLYNPKRADVRLAQTQLLLTEIDRIAYKQTHNEHSYLPTIITGDLNSTPDSEVYHFLVDGSFNYQHLPKRPFKTTSSTHQMGLIPSTLRITDQCQHADLIRKRQIKEILPRSEEHKLIELEHSERSLSNDEANINKNRNDDDEHLFSSGTLSHILRLKSVYNHGDRSDREGTTYQDRWLTVDYIFYSEVERESNKLHLMSRFRLPTVTQLHNVNIPNKTLGSDHLSLIAKFKLVN